MPELATEQIHNARIYAERIIDTVREPLIVLDEHLRVVSANRSFYQTFKITEQETVGPIPGNGPDQVYATCAV